MSSTRKPEFLSGRKNYHRDPDILYAITSNIARTLGEMIAYPQSSPNARIELADSLEDYANWIADHSGEGS